MTVKQQQQSHVTMFPVVMGCVIARQDCVCVMLVIPAHCVSTALMTVQGRHVLTEIV